MSISWLANADPATFWAHQTWPDFAALPQKEYAVVVLPLYGFADHGADRPLDQEEILGSALLRLAVEQVKSRFTMRVLPPLRFALAAQATGFFGVDPETAHELLHEIAASVRAAGFHKLVFFNASPVNEPLVATAAVDIRAALGLRTYVIHTRALGLDPARPMVTDTAPMAEHLAQLLTEIRLHLAPPPGNKAETGKRKAERIPFSAPFPAYRYYYLPALTRAQLTAIPAKDQALVVLPTAAIEQHGPHLPVGVDAILGQALLGAAIPKLAGRAPVYIAPPLTYGKSNEHVGFPGTVTLSARTLRRLVLALATQLRELGFRRLAIFNTHGGNSTVLATTVHELRETPGLDAEIYRHGFKPEASAQESAWGFHAGEWETSLMLACAPELVRMKQAVCEYPARPGDPGELRPENAPATFAWMTRDISKSGVMGDATKATVEKGCRWLDDAATALAARLAGSA
ncbi:MAG TPA: creatininase family protein [Opitutaceae bacterium]|nr:creatininase family protein [Opitutaceae bacterium]